MRAGVRCLFAGLAAVLVLAPGAHAATIRLTPDGRAVLEGSAPAKLRRAVSAANRIATKPYKYGGGHGRWTDSGYDCSGSTSYVLHAAGILRAPMTSGAFRRFGSPGPGRSITIYAKPGWVFMVIAGMRFDVAGLDEVGSRWYDKPPPSGFTVRHPVGL